MITDSKELEAYREPWEALRTECRCSRFLSFDLASLWLEVYDDFEPRVLVVEDHGEVVGIAPLALRRRSVAGIPVRTLSFIGDDRGRLGLDTNMMLVRQGRSDVMDQLVAGIDDIDWNSMWMYYMEDIDTTHQLMDGIRSRWRYHEYPPDSTITLTIPSTGKVLGNLKRNRRHNIERRIRRVEEEHDVSYREVTESGIEAAAEVYARQHIERWRDRGGSLFQDPRNVRFLGQAMKYALANGFGYGYELLVDGEVAAQTFGYIDGDLAKSYRIGMNDAYANYSPGMVLLNFKLSSLRDRGCTALDLSVTGDGDYKQHFGGVPGRLRGIAASRGLASLLTWAATFAPIDRLSGLSRGKQKAPVEE